MSYTLKFDRTNATAVILDLAHKGEDDKLTIEDSIVLTLSEVPEILMDGEKEMSLAAYGLLKLVQDRNSSLSAKYLAEMGLTGRAAIEARVDAYVSTFDLFKQGLYKAPSKAAGAKGSIDPIFAAAVAQLKGCSIVQASDALKAMDKESRAAIRKLPQIVDIISEMKEEKEEAVKLDLSDLI